ncbi:SDR family oxidoreductase [Streptomyces sp. NPDC059008]|uniref:SDR family oxidoreductase n=1 Tax=Streptomyces sp. NPDC059008 TaxID=3346693 RepID=UPI00368AE528
MARPIAVVTGASSGIGRASARRLASDGFDVVVAARRMDRLEALAEEIGGRAVRLDVTDARSVEEFAESAPVCRVLVNNAGGSLGVDRIADLDPEACLRMYETNVLGTIRVTQKLLPALMASGDGRIIVMTSLTGYQTYPGAAGYASAKYGQVAVADIGPRPGHRYYSRRSCDNRPEPRAAFAQFSDGVIAERLVLLATRLLVWRSTTRRV